MKTISAHCIQILPETVLVDFLSSHCNVIPVDVKSGGSVSTWAYRSSIITSLIYVLATKGTTFIRKTVAHIKIK